MINVRFNAGYIHQMALKKKKKCNLIIQGRKCHPEKLVLSLGQSGPSYTNMFNPSLLPRPWQKHKLQLQKENFSQQSPQFD